MERLKWICTGGGIPFLLLGCGIFFLIYLRGYPLRSPKMIGRALSGGEKSGNVSSFRALMLALAGTLGVGNIVGVADAIWLGGAGAVFWMWISALAAMILKYGEILLAVKHRRTDENGNPYGGAYYYMEDYRGRRNRNIGKTVAKIFAFLLIPEALCMGCMVQVNAVSRAAEEILMFPTWICGGLIMLAVLPMLSKGSRGIAKFTEYLVPIMSGGYLILSFAVVWLERERLPAVWKSIFTEAWNPAAAGGGLVGFLTSKALKIGTMRGLLSNEAGCGTAPAAHAGADAEMPAFQGVWGIAEVVADTLILCTATALVILLNQGRVETWGENPVMMTVKAFSASLGNWSEYFLLAAIFCFGYATVICWSEYGGGGVRYLWRGKRQMTGFRILICCAVIAGAVCSTEVALTVSDIAVTGLTVLNLTFLLIWQKEIRSETISAKTYIKIKNK